MTIDDDDFDDVSHGVYAVHIHGMYDRIFVVYMLTGSTENRVLGMQRI